MEHAVQRLGGDIPNRPPPGYVPPYIPESFSYTLVLREDRRPTEDRSESHGSMGPDGNYRANGPIRLREPGKSQVIKISTECSDLQLTFFFSLLCTR